LKWGWDEKIELEKIMFDYIRWIFGLEFCTPRYIISRELELLKLSAVWGIRAIRFEERVSLGCAGKLAKECWVEKKQYGLKDRYGEEKGKFFTKVGWNMREEERTEWNREEIEKEIIEKVKDNLRREEEEKIMKARYNKKYKCIMVREGFPRI